MPERTPVLSGLFTRSPARLPLRVGEPGDGPHHRSDRPVEMREVNAIELVAGLMVVGMQPEAGDGLSNDSPLGQVVVIRPPEEIFCRMRVGYQASPMLDKCRTQIASLKAGEPEIGRRRVGASDHFK